MRPLEAAPPAPVTAAAAGGSEAAGRQSGRVARVARRANGPGIGLLVAIVVVWQALCSAGLIASDTLPAPSTVVTQTVSLINQGTYQSAVGHTLLATVIGWAMGTVLGVALGVWLGLVIQAWRYSMATIEALRAVPPITLVPLLLLLLGFSLQSEIALSFYASFFPIVVYTIAGVRSCSPAHADVASILRLRRRDWVAKVVLPSAFPTMLVGLRIGMGLALALSVVSEMLGNPAGIGYQIGLQQQNINLGALFSYVLTTGALGWLLNAGILGIARASAPHMMRHAGEDAPQ